jgi:hypothetical protein
VPVSEDHGTAEEHHCEGLLTQLPPPAAPKDQLLQGNFAITAAHAEPAGDEQQTTEDVDEADGLRRVAIGLWLVLLGASPPGNISITVVQLHFGAGGHANRVGEQTIGPSEGFARSARARGQMKY